MKEQSFGWKNFIGNYLDEINFIRTLCGYDETKTRRFIETNAEKNSHYKTLQLVYDDEQKWGKIYIEV